MALFSFPSKKKHQTFLGPHWATGRFLMALHLFQTGDLNGHFQSGKKIRHFLPGKIRGSGLVLLDPLVGSIPDTASWHLVAPATHWIHGIGRFAYI